MSTPNSSSHQNNNNSVKSLPATDIVPTEQDSNNLPSEPSIEQLLEALAGKVPTESAEIERLKTWKQDFKRLFQFLGDRRVLIAVMEPGTFALRYANAAFCRLAVGREPPWQLNLPTVGLQKPASLCWKCSRIGTAKQQDNCIAATFCTGYLSNIIKLISMVCRC